MQKLTITMAKYILNSGENVRNVALNAYSVNKPTADGLDIYVFTNDTTGIKHTKNDNYVVFIE